ncbi:MAG: hypothetical protein IK149_00045 [Oscillospiraceae bacterium]|nr:hypothetical protein [Oscillospiraceae bacterium]
MKKLFGGLNITWVKLIIFAVICGVYTGVMAILPFTADTSFRDITTTFECWVLFAIIIIVNSKTPLDSALKVFFFFLISQPLVYLVQVPFSEMGFELFKYYPAWFRWTLLTFPMAFVGWYMRKDKWWSLMILVPMLFFVGYHYLSYFGEAVHFFPNHLLTSLFCAATMIIYPLYIFDNKTLRIVGVTLSVLIILAASVYGVMDQRSHSYDTSLLLSGGETCGIEYDDSYRVYLEDESYGTVQIAYEEAIESWLVRASFTKTGHTRLVLESPEGEKLFYDLTIERYSYEVHRVE